jgi:ATP-dependent exoDNAse (exonuclease V) beta subunit
MNPHARDERIEFSALSHSYFLDGIPVKSASFLVSRFFTAFDSYSAAKKLRPSNPLFGKSIDEIVSIWSNKGKEASDAGTVLHEQIERYFKGESYEPTEEFGLFVDFVNAHADLKPFRCEWRIFDESFHIAGTVDFIAKNKGLYEMYDWKRSKKVVDSRTGKPISNDYWGKKGIGQLKSIDDTSYNHYCLQQSLYKYILEKNYDLQVSKMYLL